MLASAARNVARDEAHLDADQLAESAVAHHLAQPVGSGVIAPHVAALKGDAGLANSFDHAESLGRRSSPRFFNEHMLAGLCECDDRIRRLVVGNADDGSLE